MNTEPKKQSMAEAFGHHATHVAADLTIICIVKGKGDRDLALLEAHEIAASFGQTMLKILQQNIHSAFSEKPEVIASLMRDLAKAAERSRGEQG